jgi:hypothetical protein
MEYNDNQQCTSSTIHHSWIVFIVHSTMLSRTTHSVVPHPQSIILGLYSLFTLQCFFIKNDYLLDVKHNP